MVPPDAFGFNLVGFATANLGHGVALRNTASILAQTGIPFDVIDLDPGGNRTGHDFSLAGRFLAVGKPTRYPVNLFHLNPPNLEGLFRDLPDLVPTAGRMNVSVLFWELARLPPSWRPMLEAMDLVLAPTRFIEAMLAESVATTPCLYYPQGFPAPEARPDRERWGIPEGVPAFLFSFDIASGIHRKHPLAPIEAFRRAFPGGADGRAVLLLKVNNRALSSEAGIMVDRIKAIAAGIPGVRVLDESLPYRDLMSLYASVDVLVSLHRGEGLGLSLMECMALGKPVIATAWSGNMDFMDADNSCLVGYTLIPPESGTQYHALSAGVEQVWADPSLDEAARWMARLAESEELRKSIGQRARDSITRFMSEAREGRVFSRVREIWRRDFARP
jgi:hypothetical protein